MQIRELRSNDIFKASELISTVFNKYNNTEGTKEAVESYINFYKPTDYNKELIKESFLRTPIAFVVENNRNVVGLIRGNKDRIINLFLDEGFHGKGLGKDIIKAFEKEAKIQGSQFIKVNASLYATKFYQRVGYKKTTGIRNFRGLRIQPMIKKLTSEN